MLDTFFGLTHSFLKAAIFIYQLKNDEKAYMLIRIYMFTIKQNIFFHIVNRKRLVIYPNLLP